MQLPVVSPNILIITILVFGGVYGLVAGKHRLRLFILSIYVGIVLAEQFTSVVAPYLKFLTIEQTSLALLGIPILIFGFARQHHGKSHSDKGIVIANIIVGIMASALIISSALRLVPTSQLVSIDGDSFIAMILQTYQLWLLGLLPVVAFVLGLFKEKEKRHK
jgi:hypothetical protein